MICPCGLDGRFPVGKQGVLGASSFFSVSPMGNDVGDFFAWLVSDAASGVEEYDPPTHP